MSGPPTEKEYPFSKGLFLGSDLKEGEVENIETENLTEEEQLKEIAIDIATGEPLHEPPATDDTVVTATIMDEGEEGEETIEDLPLKAYLKMIVNELRISNTLRQEQNKRLRDLNKILKRATGLSGSYNNKPLQQE